MSELLNDGPSAKIVSRPKAKTQVGNGDWCPVDSEHGVMYVLTSGRQYCPHHAHDAKDTRSASLFEHDGKTVVERKVQ